MASLSHILEQTVPAGKSNQNPAYARASVLTEAAAVCLQIEATPLLKVCLAKVRLHCRPAASAVCSHGGAMLRLAGISSAQF